MTIFKISNITTDILCIFIRKLCTILNNDQSLPIELKAKRKTLTKMCKKLQADDRNVASVSSTGIDIFKVSSIKKIIVAIIFGFGGGYYIYENRKNIGMLFKSFIKKVYKKKDTLRTIIENNNARNARLKRFEEETVNTAEEITLVGNSD